jgi:ABC-type multidrug transport system permease subunit
MYYQPMTPEHFLSHRNVWALNAIGIVVIWFAFVLRLVTLDANVLSFARFLVFTGGFFDVLVSTAAALGSKKMSDMQNLGLLIWAGALVLFVASMLGGLI